MIIWLRTHKISKILSKFQNWQPYNKESKSFPALLSSTFSRDKLQWSDRKSSATPANYWPDYKWRLLTRRPPHHQPETWQRARTQIFCLNIAIFREKISRFPLRARLPPVQTSCEGHPQGGSQHGLLPTRRCLPHRSVITINRQMTRSVSDKSL